MGHTDEVSELNGKLLARVWGTPANAFGIIWGYIEAIFGDLKNRYIKALSIIFHTGMVPSVFV